MSENIDVVGVHFRVPEKIYYFTTDNKTYKKGEKVVTEYDSAVRIGTVITENKEVEKEKINNNFGKILRKASEKDLEKDQKNKNEEPKLIKRCVSKIKEMNLDMKIVGCEYYFDKKKIIFYFTADDRVDFRELVKELGAMFRARIQLHQIGARDEIKLMGGLGPCGRHICCKEFIREFSPVTIKMAKEQNLSLNQSKISGACGRLMCCLAYEEDNYELLNMKLPRKGSRVKAFDGTQGIVDAVNVLKQKVRIVVDSNDENKRLAEYDAKDLIFDKQDSIGVLNKSESIDDIQIEED